MSFFYDFLKYFDLKNLDASTTVTLIVGVGAVIIGKIKIKDISENQIRVTSKKNIISVTGENLNIKSISKGELVIGGNIKNIETEWLCRIWFAWKFLG